MMAHAALEFLKGVEGELKGLAGGMNLDMHARNIRAHVENALKHTTGTFKILAAAGDLIGAASRYAERHNLYSTGRDQRRPNSVRLAEMEAACRRLERLIDAAEPSTKSNVLGE